MRGSVAMVVLQCIDIDLTLDAIVAFAALSPTFWVEHDRTTAVLFKVKEYFVQMLITVSNVCVCLATGPSYVFMYNFM